MNQFLSLDLSLAFELSDLSVVIVRTCLCYFCENFSHVSRKCFLWGCHLEGVIFSSRSYNYIHTFLW